MIYHMRERAIVREIGENRLYFRQFNANIGLAIATKLLHLWIANLLHRPKVVPIKVSHDSCELCASYPPVRYHHHHHVQPPLPTCALPPYI